MPSVYPICAHPASLHFAILYFQLLIFMTGTSTPSTEQILVNTRAWVDKAVIGLNLCPFAKAVQVKKLIRYVASPVETPAALLETLSTELLLLHTSDPADIDTTLLIHPFVLTDFYDYNNFLSMADKVLAKLDLVGEIQIASFHPSYQFADAEADDIENYTNRSPYPTLHLLRESSLDQAVAAFPDAADIFEKNIETMRRIGHAGWRALKLDK